MRQLFLIVTINLLLIQTHPLVYLARAHQTSRYGAIAYSWQTAWWGYSDNSPTQEGADAVAINNCGRPDCQIVNRFSNACGALARGRNNRIGSGVAYSKEDAEGSARSNCARNGGEDCQILFPAICTPR
jgi:hypothetical protein